MDKFWIVVLALLPMTVLYKPVTLTHRVFLWLHVKNSISVFVIVKIVTLWCYVFLWRIFSVSLFILGRMILDDENGFIPLIIYVKDCLKFVQSKGLVAFQVCTTKIYYYSPHDHIYFSGRTGKKKGEKLSRKKDAILFKRQKCTGIIFDDRGHAADHFS